LTPEILALHAKVLFDHASTITPSPVWDFRHALCLAHENNYLGVQIPDLVRRLAVVGS
jgi:hypothetical protein